jgi:uncharacterized protein (DUF2249 family)
MFYVLKQLEDGEFIRIASRDDLQQALQLAQSLSSEWPGEYQVRDSHSEVIKLPLSAERQSKPQGPA